MNLHNDKFRPDDSRPKRFGWAPGEYTNQCFSCKWHFIGDKRAYMCAECAYSEKSLDVKPDPS